MAEKELLREGSNGDLRVKAFGEFVVLQDGDNIDVQYCRLRDVSRTPTKVIWQTVTAEGMQGLNDMDVAAALERRYRKLEADMEEEFGAGAEGDELDVSPNGGERKGT